MDLQIMTIQSYGHYCGWGIILSYIHIVDEWMNDVLNSEYIEEKEKYP